MAKSRKQQPVRTGPVNQARPLFDRLLFVLALLGVLVTVHLLIQQGRGFDRGCLGFSAPGAPADCNAVVQSDAGKLFGVSNAVWGILYYVTLAALGAAVLLGTQRVATAQKVRAGLIGAGLLYSLYLVLYQATQIGEFCVLCLTSAAVVAIMAAVQVAEIIQQRKATPMTPARPAPLREAKLVGALSILVLVLAGADALYFNRLEVAAPQEQAIAEAGYAGVPPDPASPGSAASGSGTLEAGACSYNPQKPAIPNFRDMVTFADPMKGNAKAPVTVVEVFEPNCGHCKTAHPVIKEAAAKYGDKAAFYFKPVIFWPQLSTVQVHALYAAHQEGRFFEMLDRQFAAQDPRTGLNVAQVSQMADAIGMDGAAMRQKIESGTYNMMGRQQSFQLTNVFKVSSTPAILINGRTLSSEARTVECIGQLIDEAAKQQ